MTKYVCASCIEDPALRDVVQGSLSSRKCDYCGKTAQNEISCELNIITDYMENLIEEEYCDPADELSFNSKEGGYQGECLDTEDLLRYQLGFEVADESLFNDIVRNFRCEYWCQKNYYSLTNLQAQMFSWRDFCQTVKSQRRYTFWTDYDKEEREIEEGVLPTAEVLHSFSRIIQNNETTLAKGTCFWRVQVLNRNEIPEVPNRFTAPPTDKAVIANRMSPAGISMFYGAADITTAYEEVVEPSILNGKKVWAIQFESFVPLNFLDLTSMPDLPSYFSMRLDEGKSDIWFMTFFKNEIAKPIDRDDRQHIEYVPTQVFTEYVRYEMKTASGEPFHGIVYPSSKTGEACYVIFADQGQCLDNALHQERKPQLLRVVSASLQQY